MAVLLEIEIIDRIRTSFGDAIDCCEKLVVSPAKGPTYTKLRTHLRLLEGGCRQLAVWRDDARWHKFSLHFAEVHRAAGEWLRKHHPAKNFKVLADLLRQLDIIAQELRDKATGRRGTILPKERPLHRENRPVHVHTPRETVTAGGIVIPQGMGLQ